MFNEAQDLERSITRLHRYPVRDIPFTAHVTIADNASTDGTWKIAQRLATDLPRVSAVRLSDKGRGRAPGTAVCLALLPWLDTRWRSVVAVGAPGAVLAGPSAYAVETAATPHTGSIVTAGPWR